MGPAPGPVIVPRESEANTMTVERHRSDDLLRGRTARGPFLTAPSIAFVSTYPPAMCGLATFTASLRGAMAQNRGNSTGLDVLELVDDAANVATVGRPEVIGSMNPGGQRSVDRGAQLLSSYDGVILQHEYGIWGPEMGLAVLRFAEALDRPLISTLHTLLPDPSPIQRRIVESLTGVSAYTVVPTLAARDLLLERYSVDDRYIRVIPHGTDRSHSSLAPTGALHRRGEGGPRLLTWGLIGPGKGLEWALQAVALLRDRYPRIRYTIAGRTHPKVLAREGEAYRRNLEVMAETLGITDNVEFVDSYLSDQMLHSLLDDATVVVLPYESRDQMVSGVLVEAVSAIIPVVATAFPHAVELSDSGAVMTVPHRRPDVLAETIARLVDSPTTLESMRRAQRVMANDLEWGTVARRYEALVQATVADDAVIGHVSTAS